MTCPPPNRSGFPASISGLNELLDREIFDTVLEVGVLLTGWKREYNTVRLHSVAPPGFAIREWD